jgi:hypothetical protein
LRLHLIIRGLQLLARNEEFRWPIGANDEKTHSSHNAGLDGDKPGGLQHLPAMDERLV